MPSRWLYKWIKINSVVLLNAGSLVGTTAITSALGFVYWWFAARQFSPNAVGLASATVSAMLLLGTFSILGLGTLLIGELPRQQGNEGSLISASLLLVAVVGGCIGIAFAVIAPYLSSDFQELRTNIINITLFASGVSCTAITLLLDQALIGLLQGGLQLWRNTLFAAIKLLALFVVGLWLAHATGLAIYATWVFGNICSLLFLAGVALIKGKWSGKVSLPRRRLLQTLSLAALKHHLLNLTLQAPPLILPILVTVLLSAIVNAWFYVSWSVSGIANIITTALTIVLYAASATQPSALFRKVRLTLSLAFLVSVVINCVLLFATKQVLNLFGPTYAEHATWSLRILSIESFPFIIKSHYVAIRRIQSQVTRATLLMISTSIIELVASALGARLGGLLGLSLGWLTAMCIEALFMAPTVYKAILPLSTPTVYTSSLHSILAEDGAHEVNVYPDELSMK